MCLQCSAEAETIICDILPGYFLIIAKKGCKEWPEGCYGLVQCNDPDFIWAGDPLLDPTFNMSDAELEALPDYSPAWDESNRFFKLVESIEPQFQCDPITGHQFVEACKKAGYNEDKHGLRIIAWFINYIAEKMKALQK